MNIRTSKFFWGLGAFFLASITSIQLNFFAKKFELLKNIDLDIMHFLVYFSINIVSFSFVGFLGLYSGKLHYLKQNKPVRFGQIILILIIWYAISYLLNLLFFLTDLKITPRFEKFTNFNEISFAEKCYIFFPLVVFLGPLYEEFFFRGILLGTWLKNNRSKLSCIFLGLLSSIFFTLMHFEKSLTLGTWIFLSVLALYLSWVGIYYGVWQAMILHVLNNAVAFFPHYL